MTEAVLSVRDLRVEFSTRHGTLVALDGVSFDIAPGEVLGMVGESGAGKSLTGSAIIGLLEPPGRMTGGEILLRGRRIDNLPAREMRGIRGKRIGMVFQDPLTSLNPLYTIAEQLIETIRTHRPLTASQARLRAIELLDRVGIPAAARRIDDYPHHFSGGMRQRVVIALALCADPELVIADEPTTALDVSVQAQIIDLIKEISAEEITNDRDWLIDETETFCQEKAIYNGIMRSIQILDNKNTKESLDKGSIPTILADALSVSFDHHVGHEPQVHHSGRPRNLGQAPRDQAAGTGFRRGDHDAPFLAGVQQRLRRLDQIIGQQTHDPRLLKDP